MLLHQFAEQGARQVGGGPRNFTERPVHWQLDLDRDGRVLGLSPLHNLTSGKLGIPQSVPDPGRTSGVSAALGVDIGEYVLGWHRVDHKADKPIVDPRTLDRQRAFRELVERWAGQTDPALDPVPHAIAEFYRDGVVVDQPDSADGAHNVVIAVHTAEGLVYAHEALTAAEFWSAEIARRKGTRSADSSTREGLCLVCGQQGPLAKTVPGSIPGSLLPGAANKVRVISVNDHAFGYDGVKGLEHSPLCFTCADNIVTGAVYVLSRNRIAWPGQQSVTTWWTSELDAEQIAAAAVGTLVQEGSTDPERVREALDAARDGVKRNPRIATARFRAATLGANVARLLVRDWIDISLPGLLGNVRSWMDDHEVNGRVYSLWRMALSCGRWTDRGYVQMGSKSDDRLADLQDTLLHAALTGQPVPRKVSLHVLHRIWRDHQIDGPRLALLQLARRGQSVLTPDAPDQPPAYVAGRLLALLDSIQYRSSEGKVNRTFAARVLGAARTRPGLVLRDGVQMAETAWLPKINRSNARAAAALQAELAALQALITDDALTKPLDSAGQHLLVLGLGHQRHHLIERAKAAKQSRAGRSTDDQDPTDADLAGDGVDDNDTATDKGDLR